MEEFISNPQKNVEITVDGSVYLRHAIKTHYVTVNEDYIEIIKKYALPIYQAGDIVSISEKIIALCQNRVIYKKDIKLGFWAKFLSKFVHITPAGEAVGNPFKMQIAIMICGLPKVIFAAVCAGIGKLFRKKGVFYNICGPEVTGIDGFCNDAFEDYVEMGILIPSQPARVCDEIFEKTGVACMIVDANDLTVDILGKASCITEADSTLCRIIKDNPAGQASQQTPMILIRTRAAEPPLNHLRTS